MIIIMHDWLGIEVLRQMLKILWHDDASRDYIQARAHGRVRVRRRARDRDRGYSLVRARGHDCLPVVPARACHPLAYI